MNFFQFVCCLFTFDIVYDAVHLKKFTVKFFKMTILKQKIKSFVNIYFEDSLGMGGD